MDAQAWIAKRALARAERKAVDNSGPAFPRFVPEGIKGDKPPPMSMLLARPLLQPAAAPPPAAKPAAAPPPSVQLAASLAPAPKAATAVPFPKSGSCSTANSSSGQRTAPPTPSAGQQPRQEFVDSPTASSEQRSKPVVVEWSPSMACPGPKCSLADRLARLAEPLPSISAALLAEGRLDEVLPGAAQAPSSKASGAPSSGTQLGTGSEHSSASADELEVELASSATDESRPARKRPLRKLPQRKAKRAAAAATASTAAAEASSKRRRRAEPEGSQAQLQKQVESLKQELAEANSRLRKTTGQQSSLTPAALAKLGLNISSAADLDSLRHALSASSKGLYPSTPAKDSATPSAASALQDAWRTSSVELVWPDPEGGDLNVPDLMSASSAQLLEGLPGCDLDSHAFLL